jgi:hypothetical protein
MRNRLFRGIILKKAFLFCFIFICGSSVLFSQKDPVHFDSGLNLNEPTIWKRLHYILQSQAIAPKTINFTGTWVGIDNNKMWIFSGSNFTLRKKIWFVWANVEKGTFYIDSNKKIPSMYDAFLENW